MKFALMTTFIVLIAILINTLGYGNPASTIINDVDGGEMVCVPFGSFLMGSQADAISSLLAADQKVSKEFFRAEYPRHEVFLSSFYIALYGNKHPIPVIHASDWSSGSEVLADRTRYWRTIAVSSWCGKSGSSCGRRFMARRFSILQVGRQTSPKRGGMGKSGTWRVD